MSAENEDFKILFHGFDSQSETLTSESDQQRSMPEPLQPIAQPPAAPTGRATPQPRVEPLRESSAPAHLPAAPAQPSAAQPAIDEAAAYRETLKQPVIVLRWSWKSQMVWLVLLGIGGLLYLFPDLSLELMLSERELETMPPAMAGAPKYIGIMLVVFSLWRLANAWSHHRYIIEPTSIRITDYVRKPKSGLVREEAQTLYLNITAVDVRELAIGRSLGYGDVEVWVGRNNSALRLRNVAFPHLVADEIRNRRGQQIAAEKQSAVLGADLLVRKRYN